MMGKALRAGKASAFLILSLLSGEISAFATTFSPGCFSSVVRTVRIFEDILPLAIENGSVPIEHVRIHIEGADSSWPVQLALLFDYINVMKFLRQMTLHVFLDNSPDSVHHPDLHTRNSALSALLNDAPEYVRQRISIISSDQEIHAWAQDTAKPLESGSIVMSATTNPREWAELLAAHYSQTVHRLPFSFDGGNFVVGDRHIFTLYTPLAYQLSGDAKQTVVPIHKIFGKPIFTVNRNPTDELPRHYQDNFHADQIVAIVRKPGTTQEVVVVSSPAEARRVLEEYKRKSPAAEALLRRMKDVPSYFEKWNQEVDLLVADLKREGYEVELVPGLSFPRASSRPNTPFVVRKYYNYVNVVLSDGSVLMPWLNVPELDRAAEQTYQKLGLQVIPMPSSAEMLQLNGAVRCASYMGRRTCEIAP